MDKFYYHYPALDLVEHGRAEDQVLDPRQRSVGHNRPAAQKYVTVPMVVVTRGSCFQLDRFAIQQQFLRQQGVLLPQFRLLNDVLCQRFPVWHLCTASSSNVLMQGAFVLFSLHATKHIISAVTFSERVIEHSCHPGTLSHIEPIHWPFLQTRVLSWVNMDHQNFP